MRATAGHETLIARRFIQRMHVLPVQVLDDGRFVGHRFIEGEDTRRNGGAARELRRTEAARTGDQHEPVAIGADEDRLQHADAAHARRQLLESSLR